MREIENINFQNIKLNFFFLNTNIRVPICIMVKMRKTLKYKIDEINYVCQRKCTFVGA